MEVGQRRLALGFDAGCCTCSGLAARIEKVADGKLEIHGLDEPQMENWRRQALGQRAPWTPTLIEVEGAEVKAWTGRRMCLALARRLGASATWRVMQVLGETNTESAAQQPRAEKVNSLNRRQFLKGLGGAAVAMSVLSGTAVIPALAHAQESSATLPGTPDQRRILRRLVRSSRQYRNATKRAGRTFDFSRAEFLVNGSVGTAAVIVPTSTSGGRASVATFFADLQSNTVVSYSCLTKSKSENATEITQYEGDELPVRLSFEDEQVVLPNERAVSYAEFQRETAELEQDSPTYAAGDRQLSAGCNNGCCKGSYSFCMGVTRAQCLAVGIVLGPLARLACRYIVRNANNKGAGCRSFARVRCYNLHRCSC